MSHTCQARRYNDQYICERCGTQWDVSEVKPACTSAGEKAIREMREALRRHKQCKGTTDGRI